LSRYAENSKSIAAATKGLDATGWRGPIVAYCCFLQAIDNIEHGVVRPMRSIRANNTDIRAYSYIVAYLMEVNSIDQQRDLRQGVKVDCMKVADGLAHKNTGVYQETRVPHSHPVFMGKSVLLGISKVMVSGKWTCTYGRC
jgi:hypothetical protein